MSEKEDYERKTILRYCNTCSTKNYFQVEREGQTITFDESECKNCGENLVHPSFFNVEKRIRYVLTNKSFILTLVYYFLVFTALWFVIHTFTNVVLKIKDPYVAISMQLIFLFSSVYLFIKMVIFKKRFEFTEFEEESEINGKKKKYIILSTTGDIFTCNKLSEGVLNLFDDGIYEIFTFEEKHNQFYQLKKCKRSNKKVYSDFVRIDLIRLIDMKKIKDGVLKKNGE